MTHYITSHRVIDRLLFYLYIFCICHFFIRLNRDHSTWIGSQRKALIISVINFEAHL